MRSRYLLTVMLITGQIAFAQRHSSSPIEFTSSIPWLTQSFAWAKGQALDYTRTGSETLGPWYEAALPGRDAFCMRDVSHQTEGAAAMGLYEANYNMLHRFAASAAKSRDWAAYWEITGTGAPSPADYVSDNDFWFNLPANFDVLDASVRMMNWTGDNRYRTSPVFQNFARITMSDYLRAWRLESARLLTRPRIANQRQAQGRFVEARGIPSYSEGTKDFIFGADLLAAEYRAMQSFQQVSQNKSLKDETKNHANAIQFLLEKVAWSEQGHHYQGMIRKDLSGYGSGDTMVLYFGAAKDPKHIRQALDYISSPIYWKQINIEEETYIALTLFRYGRTSTAYEVLSDISAPNKARRKYPEVPYSVVSAIVGGVMGVGLAAIGDTYDVSTLSRLPAATDVASLADVSIRQNKVKVTHQGFSVTRFKNLSGPPLRWRASFAGRFDHLKVMNKEVPAHQFITRDGTQISWTDVTVAIGQEITVSK